MDLSLRESLKVILLKLRVQALRLQELQAIDLRETELAPERAASSS
jgi:hypothetical protein